MDCPECGAVLETIYVSAPAVVEKLCVITAEFLPKDRALLSGKNVDTDSLGRRYLREFRFEEEYEVLDGRLTHRDLEIDDDRTEVYCGECQSTLPRETIWQWAEEGVNA